MENTSRQIGPRHTQFKLWVAALVISEQTKRPVAEVVLSLIKTLGSALRPSDIRSAAVFQKHYEDTVLRGRDFAQSFAGGLDPTNPSVVRMMTQLKIGVPQDDAEDSERPSEPPAPEPEVAVAPPAEVEKDILDDLLTSALPSVDADTEFLFDSLTLPAIAGEPSATVPESAQIRQQQAALDAYTLYVVKQGKIPTVPYTRPDLGVTFFPTGRFDAGGVDWNYNGQVGGEMIRECGDNRLIFSRGMPLKASLDFENWAFGKDQAASGALWIWAVKHGEGKAMRFWLNDGDDQFRFYYTMDAQGVKVVRKRPEVKGSKKFIVIDERHIKPLRLDATTGR